MVVAIKRLGKTLLRCVIDWYWSLFKEKKININFYVLIVIGLRDMKTKKVENLGVHHENLKFV
ncbi:hypothetical protein CCP1ISM_50029 [Azospirillaceae bacterium]